MRTGPIMAGNAKSNKGRPVRTGLRSSEKIKRWWEFDHCEIVIWTPPFVDLPGAMTPCKGHSYPDRWTKTCSGRERRESYNRRKSLAAMLKAGGSQWVSSRAISENVRQYSVKPEGIRKQGKIVAAARNGLDPI